MNLEKIFGNKTAEIVMLYLYHFGEIYPSAISKGSGFALSQIQKQMMRFEESEVIKSRYVGHTKLYYFNENSPYIHAFLGLIKVGYERLDALDKKRMFENLGKGVERRQISIIEMP